MIIEYLSMCAIALSAVSLLITFIGVLRKYTRWEMVVFTTVETAVICFAQVYRTLQFPVLDMRWVLGMYILLTITLIKQKIHVLRNQEDTI